MVPRDQIRAEFSNRLSALYRREVPAYDTLLGVVEQVNGDREGTRLGAERHGAIRLGRAVEAGEIAALFGAMGMSPVGYYDLSQAGLPVHSTAFRPVSVDAFEVSPFRMFTSLLRLEMIEDEGLREEARDILAGRDILPGVARELLGKSETDGGLGDSDAQDFVGGAVSVFAWRPRARVSKDRYDALMAAHPLIADIVSFEGPHMNHLTPRVEDIDAAQEAMAEAGLSVKEVIEGPPRRQCPILLRQTAFKALPETVEFKAGTDWETGTHTARFGEIESRGAALTPKGRTLYDRCLRAKDFSDFPDDWAAMKAAGLAYFSPDGAPLTYEDFLPVSAAGIFRSNLGTDDAGMQDENGDQAGLETALGRPVLDMFALYADAAA